MSILFFCLLFGLCACGDSEYRSEKESVVSLDEAADVKVGDIVTFGSCEQDNDTTNGQEPIEWYVLDLSDGKMTLLSVYILDTEPYHRGTDKTTWETCTLRGWLNDEFYYKAFSEEEKERIVATDVAKAENPLYDVDAGNATTDKVYLLSLDELGAYMGIPVTKETNLIWNGSVKADNYEEYFKYYYNQNVRLMAAPTAYAQAKGLMALTKEMAEQEGLSAVMDFSFAYGSGCWWLRTPGENNKQAALVYIGGLLMADGLGQNGWPLGGSNHVIMAGEIFYDATGVRPVVNVTIK